MELGQLFRPDVRWKELPSFAGHSPFPIRSPSATTIFVVPTLALIRQVMRDIIEQFRLFGVKDVSVLCVPEVMNAEDKPQGVVYVLTQERLMSFLNGDIPIPQVSLVIIDKRKKFLIAAGAYCFNHRSSEFSSNAHELRCSFQAR